VASTRASYWHNWRARVGSKRLPTRKIIVDLGALAHGGREGHHHLRLKSNAIPLGKSCSVEMAR
jgi:hypothetical protein